MQQLQNYVLGAWVSGDGDGTPQYNAYTGDIISTASDAGLDYAAILEYGRSKGGPPLRRMTFPERGRMLKALAFYLLERKEKYYAVSHWTGATKADSWVEHRPHHDEQPAPPASGIAVGGGGVFVWREHTSVEEIWEKRQWGNVLF